MKKLFTISVLISVHLSYAQVSSPARFDKCITRLMEQEEIAKNPQYLKNQEDLERITQLYAQRFQNSGNIEKASSAIKIIPVVFHIIHEGGTENISRAQCLNQVDILNQDYRRLNADTTNTPAPFQSLGSDAQIEFRIAQLDPNGNCTDGVVRVFSHLTNDARNNVKALSYWNRNNYLNIWVVKSIENSSGSPGSVIGFAQFPGGSAATDGVVIKFDWVGAIGTAASSGGAGRTTTHEVGHWLNLRHIWGDDAGACSGSDFVSDTPNQADWTLSICPPFPKFDACTPAGNGILFSDYMDYTNGNCQNIFTAGQTARMNTALTTYRSNLYTSSNLAATGTDGTPPVTCAPLPSQIFDVKRVCTGSSLNFTEFTYNGIVTTRLWTFPGGSPATSPDSAVTVTYNTPGTYDVMLTVSNSAGSNSITYPGYVKVYSSAASYNAPYVEGFETITFPGSDYEITNANNGNTWEQNNTVAATGLNSIYIDNFSGNSGADEFISPAFDFTNVTSVSVNFKLAFAVRDAASLDRLQVFGSTDCGKTWAQKYDKHGTALASTTTVYAGTAFVPTASDWKLVPIIAASFAGQPNVRFKFVFTYATNGAYANNIYIDDINLIGTVGIEENFANQIDLMLSPNPTNTTSDVSFYTAKQNNVQVTVRDIIGREYSSLKLDKLSPGNHSYTIGNNLSAGIYSVEVNCDGKRAVKKLVIE